VEDADDGGAGAEETSASASGSDRRAVPAALSRRTTVVTLCVGLLGAVRVDRRDGPGDRAAAAFRREPDPPHGDPDQARRERNQDERHQVHAHPRARRDMSRRLYANDNTCQQTA
jgi:hypothetical protein